MLCVFLVRIATDDGIVVVLRARLGEKLMGRLTVADLGMKVDDLGVRVDRIDARIEANSAGVQTAFDEMRSFVTESIGSLRIEMLGRFERVYQRFDGIDQRLDGIDQRFDRVDRRFDRIEDKLDRVLTRRPSAPRRRRKQ